MAHSSFTGPVAVITSISIGCLIIAAIAAIPFSKKEDPVARYEFKAGDYIQVDAGQISGLTLYNSPTHLSLKIKGMDGCGLAVLYESSEVESGKIKMTFEPKNIICQNEAVSGSMSASYHVGKVTVPVIHAEVKAMSDINFIEPRPDINFLVLNNFNWAWGYVK